MDSSTTPLDEDIGTPSHVVGTDGEEDSLSESDLSLSDAEASGGNTQAKKKRKPVTRSRVWKHFTRHPDDLDKAKCNYCGKSYSCRTSSGTSNLKKHLRCCKQRSVWVSTKGKKKQQAINPDGNLQNLKISEPAFREATNKLVVLCELPLAFVESSGWREFCSACNMYAPHSRRTATRDIVHMFTTRRDRMKDAFRRSSQRISLTTDIWTAPTTGASYMVITAHFIDENWSLQKLIIGFKNIVDHKGESIASVLLSCLADWGIKKVFTITVDNASANTVALRKFVELFKEVGDGSLVLSGECLHVRCAAHILNLVVRDGMHEVNKTVVAVRNSVAYVRSSTNRLLAFQQKADQSVSRGSLSLDCKTRWNSTYDMLTKALLYKSAFQRMEAEDKLYFDFFMQSDLSGNARVGPPTQNDWDEIERLVQFLHVFYESTLVVSASSTLNAHKCYSEICTVEENLIRLGQDENMLVQTKAIEMRTKFDKYWNGLKEINRLIIIASILDPTKKMQFVELCFEGVYGEDSAQGREIAASVLDVMQRLFQEYKYSCQPTDTDPPTPGTTSSNASHSSQTSSFSASSSSSMSRSENSAYVVKGYTRLERRYHQKQSEKVLNETRTELELYLKEPVVECPNISLGLEYDVLSWWKLNSRRFPTLAALARDVLAMQVSSVASESAFSTSGRILDPYRSCLTHATLEVLMCLQQWLQCEIRMKRAMDFMAEADPDLHDDLLREFHL